MRPVVRPVYVRIPNPGIRPANSRVTGLMTRVVNRRTGHIRVLEAILANSNAIIIALVGANE